jgi:hypothetical protein
MGHPAGDGVQKQVPHRRSRHFHVGCLPQPTATGFGMTSLKHTQKAADLRKAPRQRAPRASDSALPKAKTAPGGAAGAASSGATTKSKPTLPKRRSGWGTRQSVGRGKQRPYDKNPPFAGGAQDGAPGETAPGGAAGRASPALRERGGPTGVD